MAARISNPSFLQYPGIFTFLLLGSTCLPTIAESRQTNPTDQIGDDLSPRFIMDETYKRECGSCHIAYPPMLLPIKSWQHLMSSLDSHFGDNAELESKTSSHILTYLNQNSLESDTGLVVSHWQKVILEDPPMRITELNVFKVDHKEPYRLLGDSAEEPGFFAPCGDCHKEAELGIFSKDRLFRGTSHVFRRFSPREQESR